MTYDQFSQEMYNAHKDSKINMMNIVQRGTFNRDLPTKSLTSSDGLIDLDYMGAAEYEYGAIPYSFRFIMKSFHDYELKDSGLRTTKNVPIMIFCNKKNFEEIVNELRVFIKYNNPHEIAYYRLHERISFAEYMYAYYDNPKFNEIYDKKDNFWWDLRQDFMFFVGSTDRQRAFQKAIQTDYDEWWMKLSEDKRNRLIEDAEYRRY